MSIVDQSTAITASSTGAIVTSGGGTHTKGAWTEVVASTSEETYWLQLVTLPILADENFLIDIGVGAAASEVVKIANIPVFLNTPVSSPVVISPMPLTIPSGSRVSIRVQSTTANDSLQFMLFLSNNNEFGTSSENETIGALTASSKGTPVDAGGTVNTKGAYAELSSSISIDYNYIVVMIGNNDNNTQVNGTFLVDVADGAAASEVDRVSNTMFNSSTSELASSAQPFFQSFTSGSRVSSRVQSTVTDATDRVIDVAIIGFKLDAPPSGGGGIAHIVGMGGIVG